MRLKNKVIDELKALVRFKDSNRNWQIPLLITISMGTPLLMGLYFGNLKAGLMACLGGLVMLYLPEKGSVTNRISTLLISSFGFMFSFVVGQFFSFNQIASVIAFGVFCSLIHLIILYYKTAPPRSFFFIFIASISICQPFSLADLPYRTGLLSLGTIFSSFLALVYLIYQSTKFKLNTQEIMQPVLKKNNYTDFWEAIILGVVMAVSLLLGYMLKMNNAYWIPVSCAAVMQGASRYHIWQRTFHRILGTFLGLGLCWGLLSLSPSVAMLCVFVIVLQLIVEMLVVRNYALAVIFITPLAIFLSEAANPIINSPNELILLRFQEIVIGSIIGALGGWILHKEKIRYATIKGLQKIGNGFDKNYD